MKRTTIDNLSWVAAMLLAILMLASSCEGGNERREAEAENDIYEYRADLTPLNSTVNGRDASGEAVLTIDGDEVTIRVNMSGLSPGDMHLQHYHGFVDGSDATLAGLEQDENGDGIVDLIETRAVSGITLVPFHNDPASLEIHNDTYPVAENGRYSFEVTASVSAIQDKLASTHGIREMELQKRVVYVHGVDPETELPETVQSLEGVPAHITLPVAGGELEIVQR